MKRAPKFYNKFFVWEVGLQGSLTHWKISWFTPQSFEVKKKTIEKLFNKNIRNLLIPNMTCLITILKWLVMKIIPLLIA